MSWFSRTKKFLRTNVYSAFQMSLKHLPDVTDTTSHLYWPSWRRPQSLKTPQQTFSAHTLPDKTETSGFELRIRLWGRTTFRAILGGFSWVATYLQELMRQMIGDGALYLRGLAVVFFVDALVIDDEPLWEPIEWSMVQAWILFMFLFAWIAENLIVSRYGSYTGRDKRVWSAWYKSFWLIGFWYALSMGAATLFVMVPFYYEVNFIMSFVMSWWNWYTRVFFFKFLSLNVLLLWVAQLMQLNARWWNWTNLLLLILTVTFFFSYLLYTHFWMTFFAYFTNVNWYNTTRMVDTIQLSHEPNKWGWGAAKRDHFSYHNSKTVFWYKNDGPFASALMFIQFLFLISLFLIYFYWVVLLRRVYNTQEFSYTYLTYAVSSLKQLFYFFLALYLFILLSYVICYWRLPLEFIWLTNTNSWLEVVYVTACDYPRWLVALFYTL